MTRCDLLVVGGGINGVGIARDAAGRGLSVVLVERDDLAQHTSSASTKLVHGGLRYLEYHEFRLVRESLAERETLLTIAPHIVWPLRFVLPQPPSGRPGWLIRLGLLLYDTIGGRTRLPRSAAVRFDGGPLRPSIRRGFEYSDCWVDDARLVVLNAIDAVRHGADVRPRTALVRAEPDGAAWHAVLSDGCTLRAGAIVNAAGPWVEDVLGSCADVAPERPPRLVKGSHIIVPRLFDDPRAFILQNPDRRIVFAIPYEGAFTLIGTTDTPFTGDRAAPAIDADETRYLCDSVNRYLARPVDPDQVVRSYSGVRPLYDDGRADAASVTRDYALRLGRASGPQLVSVFGGKITTSRRLAEHALDTLAPFLPPMGPRWTATAPLPGGDLADFAAFLAEARGRWPWLPAATVHRMARAYGTRMAALIGDAAAPADMGEDFGAGLSAREVDWLVATEWARTADDILWRRTKLALHIDRAGRDRLAAYLEATHG